MCNSLLEKHALVSALANILSFSTSLFLHLYKECSGMSPTGIRLEGSGLFRLNPHPNLVFVSPRDEARYKSVTTTHIRHISVLRTFNSLRCTQISEGVVLVRGHSAREGQWITHRSSALRCGRQNSVQRLYDNQMTMDDQVPKENYKRRKIQPEDTQSNINRLAHSIKINHTLLL